MPTHNTRDEFAKLAHSVKYRIEQQKTPNEEGANKALQILIDTHHQELQKAREETIEKHFTKIGMVHINAFCKLLKSHHSKGNDVMYAVRRTEQYPFIFETKADVAKEVEKYIQSELDQPIS
jgi:hypothetical protein